MEGRPYPVSAPPNGPPFSSRTWEPQNTHESSQQTGVSSATDQDSLMSSRIKHEDQAGTAVLRRRPVLDSLLAKDFFAREDGLPRFSCSSSGSWQHLNAAQLHQIPTVIFQMGPQTPKEAPIIDDVPSDMPVASSIVPPAAQEDHEALKPADIHEISHTSPSGPHSQRQSGASHPKQGPIDPSNVLFSNEEPWISPTQQGSPATSIFISQQESEPQSQSPRHADNTTSPYKADTAEADSCATDSTASISSQDIDLPELTFGLSYPSKPPVPPTNCKSSTTLFPRTELICCTCLILAFIMFAVSFVTFYVAGSLSGDESSNQTDTKALWAECIVFYILALAFVKLAIYHTRSNRKVDMALDLESQAGAPQVLASRGTVASKNYTQSGGSLKRTEIVGL